MSKADFKNKKIASEAGKKSKRGKGQKTLIKEVLGNKTFEETKEKLLENMKESIFSDNPSIREKATKEYANYFIPTKTHNKNENKIDIEEFEDKLNVVISKAKELLK